MDRFIAPNYDIKNQLNIYLKSNMDRFIVWRISNEQYYLFI